MPRFLITLHRSNGPSTDDRVGIDLPDKKAARAAAERSASTWEGETQRKGQPLGLARLEVVDEAGQLVDVVPLVTASDA